MSMSCSTSSIAVPRSSCTRAQRLRQCTRLVTVEARRRLVEQQQPRFGHRARARPRPTGLARGSATRSADPRRASGPAVRASRRRAHSRPRSASPARGCPSTARRCGDAPRSATRRCSRAVIPANSSMRWNVRPSPSRAGRCAGRPPSDAPPRRIVPCWGRSAPNTQLNSVVLPAPFGPIRPTSSRSPTVRLTSVERGDTRERHRHVLDDEERLGGVHVKRPARHR